MTGEKAEGITQTRSRSGEQSSSFDVLGVRVNAVQIPDVISTMRRWIAGSQPCCWIAVTGMHGITVADSDTEFRSILNSANLVVADGTPLVWLGRKAGYQMPRRVYGPELMETFLSQTGDRYRHFLLGGAPTVAEGLAEILKGRFHSRVVGTYCPPFRELNSAERTDVQNIINAVRPDVIWVGLSTPKQERWMAQNASELDASVAVGVGAAFDFLAGVKTQAPRWMQEHGLEWLYRLLTEPKRLWRRYLLQGSRFLWRVAPLILGRNSE